MNSHQQSKNAPDEVDSPTKTEASPKKATENAASAVKSEEGKGSASAINDENS